MQQPRVTHVAIDRPPAGAPMHLATDALLRRLAEPDPDCTDAINKLAGGSLGTVLIARLSHQTGFDDDLARDLAQETWRCVWKARGTWNAVSGAAAVAFVLEVANNVFLGSVRAEQRRAKRHDVAAALYEPAGAGFDVEDFIDLHEALARLRKRDREILTLHYDNGRTDQEIAEFLGLSYDAAKKRRQDAIRRLKDAYFNPARR